MSQILSMKRNLPWGVFAFGPIAMLILIQDGQSIAGYLSKYLEASRTAAFLVHYWWLLVGALVIGHAMYFVGSSIARRELAPWQRAFWAMALACGAPLVAPIYWWLYAKKRDISR